MQRKSLATMTCPVAQSLERVGEWWSMLIMRDALAGITRFDAFQKSLGIAPNMLTRRLNGLVEAGLLEKRRYQDNPPRYEYLPTACGQDFRPVLLALLDWGNRHFAEDGRRVVIRDRITGEVAEPLMIDRRSGRPLTDPAFERVYQNEPGQD
jgi:DNA-binding HxlR family transcriptional regulator